MPAYLKYAFYLASSWLWCIGAFLPLLLWRDFGTPAVVAFTVFNIAGAAGFGFYFRKGGDALFRSQHRLGMSIFSAVTVAFQVFFVGWLSVVVGMSWLLPAMLLLALVFYWQHKVVTYLAIGLFVVSVGLAAWFVKDGVQFPAGGSSKYWPHVVLPLAFGFVLSPYLDVTFHRAFRESEKPKATFAIGFGVLFFTLLLFVFSYVETLAAVFFAGAAPTVVLYPVLAFIVLQTAFTVALHVRESVANKSVEFSSSALAVGMFGLLAVMVCRYAGEFVLPVVGVAVTEFLYKSFLFAYGLVFPLLVLCKQFDWRFWLLLLLTAPGFVLGFLLGGAYTPALSFTTVVLLVFVVWQLMSTRMTKAAATKA